MPFTTETARIAGSKGGKREKFVTQQIIAALKDKDGAALRAIIDALIAQAMTGDVAAFNALADRAEGKVAQVIAGDQDNPVVVEHQAREFISRRILGAAARSSEDHSGTDGQAVH